MKTKFSSDDLKKVADWCMAELSRTELLQKISDFCQESGPLIEQRDGLEREAKQLQAEIEKRQAQLVNMKKEVHGYEQKRDEARRQLVEAQSQVKAIREQFASA
jgi:uncharacterized coiled-coil DUF342 family protein